MKRALLHHMANNIWKYSCNLVMLYYYITVIIHINLSSKHLVALLMEVQFSRGYSIALNITFALYGTVDICYIAPSYPL